MKTLVVDNAGWVFASKLGLNTYLKELFHLIVPPAVKEEAMQGAEEGYRDAVVRRRMIEKEEVEVMQPASDTMETVKEQTGLQKDGDIEVLALAEEGEGVIYSDDPHLESGAILLDLPLVNTTTIITYLWEEDKLEKGRCLTLLELLAKEGYSDEKILEAEAILRGGT